MQFLSVAFLLGLLALSYLGNGSPVYNDARSLEQSKLATLQLRDPGRTAPGPLPKPAPVVAKSFKKIGNTWEGIQPCGSSPEIFGKTLAQKDYKATGETINIVATLCISGIACYSGSIPRDGASQRRVREQMKMVPEYLAAFGRTSGQLHAEDMAIALAIEAGRFTRQKFVMSVYGIPVQGMKVDYYKPCMDTKTGKREVSCTSVLDTLGIRHL